MALESYSDVESLSRKSALARGMSVQAQKSWQSLAAGAVAGSLDTCVTMPLDTVKTKMQIQQHAGVFSCVRTIIRADGAAGLYYGFTPFLVQASGKAAVRFCMFDLLVRGVDAAGFDRSRNSVAWSCACGLGAGMAEALFWTAPTERIKVLSQARAGEGLLQRPSLGAIVSQQGFSGLYVGASATAMRQATSVAARFTILDHTKSALCASMGYEKSRAPTWVTFLGGGLGGFVSAVMNNPIDVVKSRIQAGGGGVSVLQCVRETLHQGGARAFMAGITARSSRLFLSQAIQFSVVDKFTKTFGR